MKSRLFGFCVLLLFSNLGTDATAGPEAFQSKIENIFSTDFPQITVRLKVFTKEQVRLTSENFEAREDQKEVATFSVRMEQPRQYYVLVIDRSSSIEPAMPQLKEAAAAFVAGLPPQAKLSVVSFGSDVQIDHDFTADRQGLTTAIRKLRPFGGTCLYDAIFQGCEMLKSSSTRRDIRTIVCLTDGRDSNPRATARMSIKTPEEAVKAAVKHEVRVIAVGLGSEVDVVGLKALAQETGGAFLPVSAPEKLLKLYQQLAHRMKLERYLALNFPTPNPERDGTTRQVQILSKILGAEKQGVGTYMAPTPPQELPNATSDHELSRPPTPKGKNYVPWFILKVYDYFRFLPKAALYAVNGDKIQESWRWEKGKSPVTQFPDDQIELIRSEIRYEHLLLFPGEDPNTKMGNQHGRTFISFEQLPKEAQRLWKDDWGIHRYRVPLPVASYSESQYQR